ncbi:lysine-specific demethylase JMJ31 [Aristolochia californica]|uniref:lysine-specific demethylase JMJ31 n=1 Tax=Aristolochia californica TaxID=171875 RepID=UPI0035DAEDEB
MDVKRLEEVPSLEDFSSEIEYKNVPAVFNGCIKEWKAFMKWNPSNGGLDYLQERVGSSTVEAMLSKSAPVFYGDLRNHERVSLPFHTFITSCKQLSDNMADISSGCVQQELSGAARTNSNEPCLTSEDAHHIYLAQVPILNVESQERSALETLLDDIQKPSFIKTKSLASINLWMNGAHARSSTHYDPHHNLLCVVAGRKQVVLWPPSASPLLYPMAIYGEASNHSAVDVKSPDFLLHPRAKHAMECSKTVILHAGDALFIPEGWFHQVDSDDLTIAVNFWWQSNMMLSMLEHMDAYYLRRIMKRLVDKEMNEMLSRVPFDNSRASKDACEQSSDRAENCTKHLPAGPHNHDSVGQDPTQIPHESNKRQGLLLNQLEPHAIQALHRLVSLVHDSVNVTGQSQEVGCSSLEASAANVNDGGKHYLATNSSPLGDDPVAGIILSLEPLVLRDVLLSMVHNFPRTLEALVLHKLSPLAAEVLTRKFDEMDQQSTTNEQSNFYQLFYRVFDDQFAAMDAILNGKESFAFQAFKNVLDQCLGVNGNPSR